MLLGQFNVEAAHDESNDGLSDKTEDRGVFGSDGIDDERTEDGSKEIERAILEHSE